MVSHNANLERKFTSGFSSSSPSSSNLSPKSNTDVNFNPDSDADPTATTLTFSLPKTRSYQQEMLEESLKRNIVIALDTGAGKTHIAVLRLKHEAERQNKKTSWFLTPTVSLCAQQHSVISTSLPVPVALITGAQNPDQWKSQALWSKLLAEHQIIVSTPQVLLDALRHGYVNLGRDIGLLVFDEAHHAVDKHPYNAIMSEFYEACADRPTEQSGSGATNLEEMVKPFVLGLTASPIFGGNLTQAFAILERNLHSMICGPRLTRDELATHVHRPTFKYVFYSDIHYDYVSPSRNVQALSDIVQSLDITEDPFVVSLREKLQRLSVSTGKGSSEYNRADQRLSRAMDKKDSFTHKGLRDFLRTAEEICYEIGVWAADWYVWRVLSHALRNEVDPFKGIFEDWQNGEKTYLLKMLSKVNEDVIPVSFDEEEICRGISSKTEALLACLQSEKAVWDESGEIYSGIVFVTRRDAVLALAEVLERHPVSKDKFTVGCLIGSSESVKRRSFLDITNNLLKLSQTDTLRDFRAGEKNVLISTAVAEEGIDIQACGSVIRWDPPPNMVSWVQSRGRARRERSSFVIMLPRGMAQQSRDVMMQWERMEENMVRMYTQKRKEELERAKAAEESFALYSAKEKRLEFRVKSTGALLSLDSAISHLSHFCSVLPQNHSDPIYDVDPPDYPLGYHSESPGTAINSIPGPFGATVTLPRSVPADLRVFKVEREHPTKASAMRHAAFKAYVALYKAELLNDYLLPLTSVLEPNVEEEVKELLENVEKRSGVSKASLQLDPWVADISNIESNVWWRSDLSIEGLPTMTFFSRCPILESSDVLYDMRQQRKTCLIPRDSVKLPEKGVELAAKYTRYIFSIIHGNKMDLNNLHFSYLLWPNETPSLQHSPAYKFFETQKDSTNGPVSLTHKLMAVEAFIQDYGLRENLTLLVHSTKASTSIYFEFVGWRTDALSDSENETLRQSQIYMQIENLNIQYPLIVARQMPRRANFLLPYKETVGKTNFAKSVLLLPQYTSIGLASPEEVRLSLYCPSLIRSLSLNAIASSFHSSILIPSPLHYLPVDCIKPAIITPKTSDTYNYERLETLGDTVLKFITSLQLIAQYPFWHEGYLTKKKDHAVNNGRLAKAAIGKELYRWIIRDRFSPRRWKPHYTDSYQQKENVSGEDDGEKDKTDDSGSTLSTKVLADVVEALIGVAYLEGGFEGSIECARLFDVHVPWGTAASRLKEITSRIEVLPVVPNQLQAVEKMLDYTFKRKALLVEALMHASYRSDISTVSYERMEFLGDAILDMVAIEMLYNFPNKYSPGHLHMRKSAITNKHFLGFICLRFSTEILTGIPELDDRRMIRLNERKHLIYLWQCLLHSSSRISDDMRTTYARYEIYKDQIEQGLNSGEVFPWAALTKLQTPKFFSDMIESVVAATYLDSDGDMTVVKSLLERLGIIPILRRIIDAGVDVLHPVSRFANYAAKIHKTAEYLFKKEDGNMICILFLDEDEVCSVSERYTGKASEESLKFRAAEEGMALLLQPSN